MAHCPASGVNTYDPEFTLSMVAGVQEPVTPIGEIVAKIGATEPAQKSAMGVKSGLRFGTTVTAKVCVVAH